MPEPAIRPSSSILEQIVYEAEDAQSYEQLFRGEYGRRLKALMQERRRRLLEAMGTNRIHDVHLELVGKLATADEIIGMIVGFE